MKTRREELAGTQEDRAGLHRTDLSDGERGTRNVSLVIVERLAEALGRTLAELYERV